MTTKQPPVSVNRNGQLELDLTRLAKWDASVGRVRDCILEWMISSHDFSPYIGRGLPEAVRAMTCTQLEVEAISHSAREAALCGRLFDFGHLPNEVIKEGAKRGGKLWDQHALGMPFAEPWVLYHTWEGGTAVYLVGERSEGVVEVCEFQPFAVDGTGIRTLVVGDRAQFRRSDGDGYHASVVPFQMRFFDGLPPELNLGTTPEAAAASNCGDPVWAALLILNTRNVGRETIHADAKLQKARARSGKPPIPPHERIDSLPYVTAVTMRGTARERVDHGGHHASPVPHVRRGHVRTYESGKRSWIADTLVNVDEATRGNFLRSRSHYEVKP